MSATVSVLIPAYNEASRIATTLESVLAQTHPPHEVIVVDDGSTDATADVASAFPVRVLRKANGGISSARNLGLREAHGTWVAFLDADDRWSPTRLEWLARAAALDTEIGFGFSDYVVEEGGGANAPSNNAQTPQYLALDKTRLDGEIFVIDRRALGAAVAVGNFFGTSTTFVKRTLVERHALYFDESLPHRTAEYQVSEDVEWYLRVIAHTDAFSIERVLAAYVRRTDSLAVQRGRVRYGDVFLGERIAAAPDRYVSGASAAFAAERQAHMRHAIDLHLRAADFSAARMIATRSLRERMTPADLARLIVASLADNAAGRTLTRSLRAAVRGMRNR